MFQASLSGLKNDELRSAVPKPGDEFSAQMPVTRTQEFPSFTASCFQKVFPFLGRYTIYGDFHLSSFISSAISSTSVTTHAGTYPLKSSRVKRI
jgi:hypothetical protein